MEVSDIVVYKETNYDLFKKLLGNREVGDERVNAIIESIKKIGYQPVPLLVNEKFEVIDGEGRLEACKRLSLPIYFEIKENIGIEECIAMNIKMRNWVLIDFINSFAVQENSNYVSLLNYKNKFPKLTEVEIAMCLSNAKSRNIDRPLRDGSYKIIETEETIGCLNFINSVVDKLDSIKGGRQEFTQVLVGLYKLNLIDEDRMRDSICNHSSTIKPAYSIVAALTELQTVYNHRRRYNEYFRDNYLSKMETFGARYKS